jgi:hypothetical protein
MRHPITDDKIVLRLDGDGHWTYFSVRDERDNGTIVDFLQRRGCLTLGAVRQEVRAWSGMERLPAAPRASAAFSQPVSAYASAFPSSSLFTSLVRSRAPFRTRTNRA